MLQATVGAQAEFAGHVRATARYPQKYRSAQTTVIFRMKRVQVSIKAELRENRDMQISANVPTAEILKETVIS